MYAIEKEDEKLVEFMLAKGAIADYEDVVILLIWIYLIIGRVYSLGSLCGYGK